MPFNYKSPVGYLITLSFESFEMFVTADIVSYILCFLFGSCFLLKLFVEDVTSELSFLNLEDKATSNGKNSAKDKAERMTMFFNAVQNHSDLKQLA